MNEGIESFRERLEGRLAKVGLSLGAEDADRLERYYRLLIRWNAKINLTSLQLENCPASTLDRLFVEPLLAAELVPDRPLMWFDLGSGGGSPAIPLKVVRPAASLTMVDSVAKKGVFLREASRNAELAGVIVITARIEELPGLYSAHLADLLTIRAVRIDPRVIETASYLLKPGGRLLHFGSGVDVAPVGFKAETRRELMAPSDSLTVFERS